MKQFLATLSLVFSLSSFSHPGRSRRRLIGSMLFAIALCLTACGDDSSTSVNDDESSSSTKTVILSSSEGSSNSSSSAKSNGSSSSTKKSSSSRMDSIGSSSLQNDKKSSSSMKSPSSSWTPDGGIGSSNSTKKPSSSSKTVVQSSSSVTLSATSVESNGSSAASSSSEYVPFDHSKTLASVYKVGENAYKQFTDPRNGRSYYYIKIIGKDRIGRKDSVTIMAENLNIGEMIDGYYDQKDDDKIERYCYNNDTTYCDEFGGLYQWAEMMQLPSRCNMESCSSLIEENHRGICPEGWRLMTYDDFYIAWHAETNEDGVKGLRSTYRFSGSNASGLSFVGAGWRTPDIKTFEKLLETAYWFYPKEVSDEPTKAFYSLLLRDLDYAPSNSDKYPKTYGYSVRCVKVEQ